MKLASSTTITKYNIALLSCSVLCQIKMLLLNMLLLNLLLLMLNLNLLLSLHFFLLNLFGLTGVAMGHAYYRFHRFMQMPPRFLPNKEPLGDRFAWTTTTILHIVNTSPVDSFVVHTWMRIPIAIRIHQKSPSKLALCEASFLKSCKMNNNKNWRIELHSQRYTYHSIRSFESLFSSYQKFVF